VKYGVVVELEVVLLIRACVEPPALQERIVNTNVTAKLMADPFLDNH